jgi:hypothetical protein
MPLVVSELCPYEKVQNAIIPKLGKAELLFFALHF